MSEEVVFVRRASGLIRELGWFDIAIWALATPAASGMTYYAVKILGDPSAYGGNIALAFFIAGLMFLPLVIGFALIVASFPRSGSLYVFVSRTIHPVLGFIPFWYFVIGGGAAIASGFLLFIGIKALSGPIVVAGLASGSTDLINIGEALINPINQMIIAMILVAVIWAINYTGMRVIKWVMRILTITPLTVTVAILIALLTLGPNGGVARFDAIYGQGASEKIMQAAFNESVAKSYEISILTPNDLWAGTYGMLLWTLWAWTGLEIVTFVGSEVKDPSRSYLRGYAIGFTLVMILYLANAAILPWVFNYNFLAAYSYLKYTGEEMKKDIVRDLLGGKPAPDASVPFYAAIAFSNVAVALLIGLAYFLWYLNTVIPIWVGGVRGLFAMAFDRILPEKISEVSARWAAPTWANHITALLALFGAFMSLLENMGFEAAKALISFLDFSVFLFVWPTGLALMLVPWWRPELFERMIFPSKILASAVGAIVFALGWFFMIITSYSNPMIVLINILVGLIGLIIFTAMSARNRARGIDPSKIYTQIPPA
ncbi:MAG: APC family permease [Sulfolobales archaeon]